METVLITGGTGFVGNHLVREIQSQYPKSRIFAAALHRNKQENSENVSYLKMDVTDKNETFSVIKNVSPSVVFHLAAQSSVAVSWKEPELTIKNNVIGSLNLIGAIKENTPKSRIILVSSGEEYGIADEQDCPFSEDFPAKPGNVYAVSKNTQSNIGLIYAKHCGMDIVITRAFNHIGPGQSEQFVVPDFCSQASDMKKGLRENVFLTGNLGAKRDFTDVRDIVKAYVLLAEKGSSGEIYNVCSGKAVSIAEILRLIIKTAGIDAEIRQDPNKIRPSDVPVMYGNAEKIGRLGWKPQIPLQQTIKDILESYL